MADKTTIPKGYKSVEAFLAEARQRYQESVDFDRENTEAAKTDLEFTAGDQWDDDDVKARKGRSVMTINQIPQFIAQIVGDIRLNRPAIKVRPAEDADKDLADIREGLIRSIEHNSNAQQVYAAAGQTQVACGIGNFRVVVDYADGDAFEKDIIIKAIPNPFAVKWDANRTEPTGKDARFCFIDEDVPRKVFEADYPDAVPGDLGADLNSALQSSGWLSRDTVRVSEYWVLKERDAEIALLQDGSVKEITPENAAQLEPQIATNNRGEPMRRKSRKKYVCVYLITGHTILQDAVEYPISRLPVFRVPGWEINTGAKTVRFGLVRFAKDPQRLKNYWRSVAADTLALAPKQQWLVHENGEGDAEEFRNAHNSGDNVLVWAGSVPPQRIDPPAIPAALLQEAAQNTQDMKDVTGIHDASLGIKSNETSGKAILARQKEGDVASYIYHDNLKAAISECGNVVNEFIPTIYDTARTARVLGEDGVQKLQRVNDPLDPKSVDLAKGKFDIVVETGPSYSTKRQEASESMAQFFQVVPQAAQAAGDLFAKAMDWPMASEIGDRLKKTLPPGLAEDDPSELTPEQQQARQQQDMQAQEAQAMQKRGAELQLAEAEAKVNLTNAQAAKTMAEAQSTGAPQGPQEMPADPMLERALLEAQVRKANADADRAEAEAMKAQAELNAPQGEPVNMRKELAETETAEAKAEREKIAVASDLMDLHAKPTDQDLQHKQAEKALKDPPAGSKPKG